MIFYFVFLLKNLLSHFNMAALITLHKCTCCVLFCRLLKTQNKLNKERWRDTRKRNTFEAIQQIH